MNKAAPARFKGQILWPAWAGQIGGGPLQPFRKADGGMLEAKTFTPT
jgi:hypothetical protein